MFFNFKQCYQMSLWLSLSLLNYVFITMLIHSLFVTRLEAANPNVAFPGMPPICSIFFHFFSTFFFHIFYHQFASNLYQFLHFFSTFFLHFLPLFVTRLEAVNPNVAFPGMPPTCTIGWKTLKEDDDADHFTFLGDDRTLDIEDQSRW